MTVKALFSYTAGPSVLPPWQAEQEPGVRGVVQTARITAVDGANVPGSGPYRPASAMRVELRSFHSNDITVTATAPASAADSSITVSLADAAALGVGDFLYSSRSGETLRVNGAISGTTVPVRRGAPNTAAASVLAGDTFTVPGGDVNDSGSDYATSRAEVYGRFSGSSQDAADVWPDPVGSERWYDWSVYLPSDFATNTDGTVWLTTTQWKGAFTGSPPIGMEIKRSNWQFGGLFGYGVPTTTGANGDLGAITPGAWTHFLVGMKLSPDPAVGWVELYRDGVHRITRTNVATMNYKTGTTPDPIYLKQGLYRDSRWTDTHVLHYGPMKISDSYSDFDPTVASSPATITGTGEFWGIRI